MHRHVTDIGQEQFKLGIWSFSTAALEGASDTQRTVRGENILTKDDSCRPYR